MPPKTKLDEATLADFEAWVAMGAPDPREGKAASIKKVFWTQEQVDNHWAYQPIAKPVPPTVKGDWARTRSTASSAPSTRPPACNQPSLPTNALSSGARTMI